MSAKSKDVGRDIAKLALSDARYDSDTLEEVFAYCWDQLCWRKTDTDLIALRDGLSVEGSEGLNASALLAALKALLNHDERDAGCMPSDAHLDAQNDARIAITRAEAL